MLESPYSTNAAVDSGRTMIFVVDDESIRPGAERPTRQAAGQFLAGLSPRDRVALFTVPHGGMKVDLTSDFDKVRTALGQITGQAPETESLSDAACRTRTDLQSIAGMLDNLAGGQGPVTVVFLTSTLTGSRSQTTMSRNTATSPTGSSLPGARTMGTCELQPEEFDKVAAAAMQARAHFYIIQPDLSASARLTNPSGGTGIDPRVGGDMARGTDSYEQGINDLAGVTNGEHYPLSSTGDNALIRIALETSAYYAVTFEPEDLERNGASHRVELKVSRPGVSLRTLPGVVIASATAASAPPVITPKTMLGEMRAYRDLTLRAAGFTARYQTGKTQIIVAFEADDPLVNLTSAMAGIFDASGKLVGSWVAEPANLAKTPVTAALVAPPGKYRIRVAATDKSGRSGATDLDIDTNLTSAGTLKMGSLALGRTKDNIFIPKLQFSDEAVVIAYLELYGQRLPDDRPVVAMFQVAKSADGPALLVQPASIDETSVPDRFIVEAAIPLAALEPGDYVVRALIGNGVEGEPMGRVIRTLRKTAK
jgi:hypothetical protein